MRLETPNPLLDPRSLEAAMPWVAVPSTDEETGAWVGSFGDKDLRDIQFFVSIHSGQVLPPVEMLWLP